MFILFSSLWFLNLFIGHFLFQFGFRRNLNSFYIVNVCFYLMFLHVNKVYISSNLLTYISSCTPVVIGVLPLAFDLTAAKRNEEKTLQSIIVFLNIVITNMKYGKTAKDSFKKSFLHLLQHKHLKIEVKKNVVLQQPKSRYYPLFHELERDLNLVLKQNFSQKELLTFIHKKYKKKLTLLKKTKIALSQYKSQTYVVVIFWLLAFGFLISQGLLNTYKYVAFISLTLMIFGMFISKKLLLKSEFRL